MEHEAREGDETADSFGQIGADLNAARLACGIQINELSQLLRISKGYLKDIEAGAFDALPGPTYVSGYLRSFSREVGLDPVELVQRYRALLGQGEDRPAYSFPVDQQRPQRSGAMMASIIVIFAVAGYGGWYALGKPDILTSLTGEAPVETAALPQVESAVTEPDDMSRQDAEPVDLAASSAPAAVGTEDMPADEGATVTTVADAPAGTVPQGATATAAKTLETPLVVEAVAPPRSETTPDTVPAVGAVAATDNLVTPPGATSEDAAPATAGLADSASSASDAPAVFPEEDNVTDLAAADSAADSDINGAATGASAPAVVELDDRVAAVTPDAADMSDSMDGQLGTGVAYARQRVPDMEITLRATGASWVEIIRNDGEEVMTKLMRAGETYLVDSRDRLYLSTGNAGGLELVFNDGTTRAVGDSGEILRDLLLDATKLRNQF